MSRETERQSEAKTQGPDCPSQSRTRKLKGPSRDGGEFTIRANLSKVMKVGMLARNRFFRCLLSLAFNRDSEVMVSEMDYF